MLFNVLRRSFSTLVKRMSQKVAAKDCIIWVDLEMTGLDVERDHIIEMACVITDGNLNTVAEGPDLVIHQSDEILDGMGEWCVQQHGKTGLTAAVRKSKLTLADAEDQILALVKQYTPMKTCPLAGNSVHVDKKFLDKYMPEFVNHLHYRIIDVSTIKELCKRWYPDLHYEKKNTHRALDDIYESIEELKFYRKVVFKP